MCQVTTCIAWQLNYITCNYITTESLKGHGDRRGKKKKKMGGKNYTAMLFTVFCERAQSFSGETQKI